MTVCPHCLNYGSDPENGTCPLCNPYCERCDQRWSAIGGTKECPRCVPTFLKLETRTEVTALERPFIAAMRSAASRGVHFERMLQLVTWEWMHQSPTQALIPQHFEPASTLHPPEKVFETTCGTCRSCTIARIGCGCDGSFDDGCFLCSPERHVRPPCPA